MAHLQKYTKAVMGHMFNHYGRSELSPENYVVRSNENIDKARIKSNYNLAQHQKLKQMDFINQRLSEVKVQNRKDVNIFCDWIVTVPKNLSEEEHRLFFENSYEFLEKRYGKENVISSYVHMDETTPHMHFAFIPVVKDQKKGGYKVSAKELITRIDLKTFHHDLSDYLEKEMGHPISILNEATKEGNQSIEALKRKSAKERLEEITKETAHIVSKAKNELTNIETSIMILDGEYRAKKAYIQSCDQRSKVSEVLPDYAAVKKSLLGGKQTVTVPLEKWEERHISANEKNYLKQATKEFEKTMEHFKKSASAEHINRLEKKIINLEKELSSAKNEQFILKNKLRLAVKETDKIMEKVDKVLGNLPQETAKMFIDQWKKVEIQQKKTKFYI